MVLKLFTTFIVVAAIFASLKHKVFTWSYKYIVPPPSSDHQASLQCKESLQGFVAGTIVLGKTRINAIFMA